MRRTVAVLTVVLGAIMVGGCEGDRIPLGPMPVTTTGQPQSAGFTATGVRVDGTQGSMTYNVVVPQVDGGKDTAAQEFNSGMRALMQEYIDGYGQAKTVTDDYEQSNVAHIGTRVLSGVLWVSIDGGGAHPFTELSTHVTNVDTAQAITLGDVFKDESDGLDILTVWAAKLLPEKFGDDYNRQGILPTADNFSRWVATPEGMRVYFAQGQVAASAAGVVDIMVPWSALSAYLQPGMEELLSS